MGKRPKTVAVIGAGWAGCAAAVELSRKGHRVTLLEAARVPGGRARRVEWRGLALDNGQHILLGAYRDTLKLMKRVGVDPAQALLRLPLQMRHAEADGMDFVAPRLPAPFHVAVALLRARGLSREDKLALARFTTAARWMDWRLDADCSVAELLERFEQTARVVRLMWRPLCVAALNTPPERASAIVFLSVLRDSLGARRAASDMLLPRRDLSALFPLAAAAYVERLGGGVKLGCRVDALVRDDGGWLVDGARHDAAIVATPPWVAQELLAPHDGRAASFGFDYEAITTCYLQYAESTRLDQPFRALLDDPERGRWGQFVFDRGQLDAEQAGLMAVVVSASGEASALGQDGLADAVAAQLGLGAPLWSKLITEKRATFACTPDLARPGNKTHCEGLWLAGDYTAGDYPATIEGAVRSGLAAARGVLAG